MRYDKRTLIVRWGKIGKRSNNAADFSFFSFPVKHRKTFLEALRDKIREQEVPSLLNQSILPFGVPSIDEHLPGNGLRFGCLHDVDGDASAVLFAAGILARTEGPVLWCAKHHDLFPPALRQAGLHTDRILFVEVADEEKLLACFEEGLRYPGIGGAVAEIGRLSTTASRRLQLAAESSGALAIALWRWRRQNNPTVAHTSWRVSAAPSLPLLTLGLGRARWHLELLRCRGGEPATFTIEACDETGHIALSAPLAHGSGTQAAGHARALA